MVDASETHVAASSRRPRRSWSRRRLIVTSAAIVVVLVAGAAAMLAVQGLKARSTLTAAIPLVEQIEDGIRSDDTQRARQAVAELRRSTEEARAAATGPLWSVASIVPWVGPNVAAVSTTTVVIDDITRDVLDPLVSTAGSLDYSKLGPVDGRIDLEPLAAAEPALSSAAAAFAEAHASMDAIDADQLVRQIAAPVGEIQEYLDTLAPLVQTGARAARLLPPMLGADGPRTYLVMFQNTAEIRATGGIPGAFAIIRVDDGRLSLVHQGTAGEVGLHFPEPVLALDPAKEAIYTERLGRFFTGVNLSPDFPTAATLAAEMVRRAGFEVDGVVATDPVALSYLLGATGPLSLPVGGELTADNAVSLLLSDVYWQIDDRKQQDVFFAATAAAVFAALTSGAGEPVELVDALATAADERRLLVWSAHDDEQQELQGTVLSGAFDDSTPSASALGVFLNDGTGAKMQYYLETEVKHVETICADATRYDTLSVALTSTAPPEAVDEFPRDVTGVGNTGVATGSVRTNVYFYGAAGGDIRSVLRDGTPVDSTAHADGDRPVRIFTTDLAPGESVTFEVQMSQPDRGEVVEVWSTPTVSESGRRAAIPACSS